MPYLRRRRGLGAERYGDTYEGRKPLPFVPVPTNPMGPIVTDSAVVALPGTALPSSPTVPARPVTAETLRPVITSVEPIKATGQAITARAVVVSTVTEPGPGAQVATAPAPGGGATYGGPATAAAAGGSVWVWVGLALLVVVLLAGGGDE